MKAKTGHTAFNVRLNGRLIDTVFYSTDGGAKIAAEEVRRGLVNHDGYDPRITVCKRRTKA